MHREVPSLAANSQSARISGYRRCLWRCLAATQKPGVAEAWMEVDKKNDLALLRFGISGLLVVWIVEKHQSPWRLSLGA